MKHLKALSMITKLQLPSDCIHYFLDHLKTLSEEPFCPVSPSRTSRIHTILHFEQFPILGRHCIIHWHWIQIDEHAARLVDPLCSLVVISGNPFMRIWLVLAIRANPMLPMQLVPETGTNIVATATNLKMNNFLRHPYVLFLIKDLFQTKSHRKKILIQLESYNITPKYIQAKMQEQQQQQYQLFWHNRMNVSHSHQQLVVDYDTFITRFCEEIELHTMIVLAEEQKLWIKAEVDPENQNQVYKNGYLLFVKNFWALPSNRTKFFNMKLNLSRLRTQPNLLPMAGLIKLVIGCPEEQEDGSKIPTVTEYLIKDRIISVESCTSGKQDCRINQIKYEGFITIGSDEQICNIVIKNAKVNCQHLKLIYSTNLEMPPGVKSTPSFIVNPRPTNRLYIRDISKSNRVKYSIDREEKFVLLKKGMVICGIGLIQNLYEIVITSVPVPTEAEINAFLTQANSDRISYVIGQPDKPKKVITDLDMGTISEGMVIDMLDRGLYYPEKPSIKSKNNPKNKTQNSSQNSQPSQQNKKGDDSKSPMKLTIRNLRTLKEQTYSSKSLKAVKIGRDPKQCDIVIDDISIRPLELNFQNLNEIWFLRKLATHESQLFLAHEQNLQNYRSSNRIEIGTEYPQKFYLTKDICLEVSLVSCDKSENDDQYGF